MEWWKDGILEEQENGIIGYWKNGIIEEWNDGKKILE